MAAVLNATSFDSGLKARDKEVRSSRYLHTNRYPDISFTCTLIDQTDGKWIAVGVLTAHGVTQPVDVTLDEFSTEPDGDLALHATARVDRYAHGITFGKGLAGRWLDIDITAIATR